MSWLYDMVENSKTSIGIRVFPCGARYIISINSWNCEKEA